MLSTALNIFGSIVCGTMAGVFIAFSVVVLPAFAGMGPTSGVRAMNAVNRAILTSLFMPLFFGSIFLCALTIAVQLRYPNGLAAALTIASGAVYLIGMLGVTVFFNVPLNKQLERIDPDGAAGSTQWTGYVRHWTRWNHVRGIASVLASLGLAAAAHVAN